MKSLLLLSLIALYQPEDQERKLNEQKYTESIKKALNVKPASISTIITLEQPKPNSPCDIVKITLEYDSKDKNSLGFDKLRVEITKFIGHPDAPKSTYKASKVTGDKTTFLVSGESDKNGGQATYAFSENPDKLKAVEERVKEVLETVEKVLPKEPQKRK